jgi:arylsulfatase
MWLEDPHYVPERDGYSHMHEGRKGKGVKPVMDQQLTLDMKKRCDLEYQKRGVDFMRRAVAEERPFFLYFNHSLMHFPMIPRDEFVGKSTNGEWGDCLLMLDHDFGVLLDQLESLGVADNTIVVLCGDNGAEDHLAGRGTGGFFDGSYFSSAEGGIRTPLLIRWPGRVPAGIESNEMVHVTDMFTTLLGFAGCKPPADRLIDGVDQGAFLLGQQGASNREACMVWLKDELHAVKWKDFKINFKRQQHFHDPELPLGFARITHLQEDPKEREAVNQRYVRWWVMQHAHRVVRSFEDSTREEALIPPGAPLGFVPRSARL